MSTAVSSVPAWLQGGSRPRHIAAAVILGTVAGAVGGWNLTFALLVTLALLHNGPALTAAVAACVGCAAAHLGANLTTAIGSFLLEKVGLGAVIESLGHAPLTALFGLHDYQLLGSATLALALSLPAAHALTRRCATPTDDEAEPDSAPLLRPWGCTAAIVCTAATVATLHVAAPQRVGEAMLAQFSAAAQVPVTADHVHYDLFNGTLHLTGLRVSDLDEPGRIAVRVDSATAQVKPGLLLRGRLHADHVTLSGLTYDADPNAAGPPKLFRFEQPTVLRESDPTATVDPTQPIEVAAFVPRWNDATVRLSALGRLIAAVEGTADLETPHAAVAQRLQASRRPTIEPRDAITGRSLPLVQIKKLRVDGLPAAWSLGDDAHLEIANVTSRPSTSPRGVQLTLEAPAQHAQLAISFRLSGSERRHETSFTCDSCPAGDLVDLRRTTGIGLETTTAPTLALRGRGTVGRDRLDLSLACDVVGIRPTATAGRFGNLDAAVWRAGIERLGGLRFDATLAGRWNEPHLQLTPAAAVDQLKHQLRSVGEHALVKAVEAGSFSTVAAPAEAVAAKTETKTDAKLENKVETAPEVKPTATAVADVAKETAPTTPKTTETPKATETASAKTDAPKETTAAKPTEATTPKPHEATPTAVAATTSAPVATPTVAKPPIAATPITATSPSVAAPTAPSIKTPILSTPNVPALPTVTLPSAPSAVTTASASAPISELRQPASVLDPSAKPGLVNWKVGAAEPVALPAHRTRIEPRPAPTVAPRNLASPASSGAAVVINDEPMRKETKPTTSFVGKWFAAEGNADAQPTAELPITAPSPPNFARNATTTTEKPSVPQPEQTAAKPWFPRVRKFFGEDSGTPDGEVTVVVPPEMDLAERKPAPNSKDDRVFRPNPTTQPKAADADSPIQTAKQPWYERMFR